MKRSYDRSAEGMRPITGSAIREIFKLLGKPGMISFAGGNPSNAALEPEVISELAAKALRDAADGYQTGGWADDLPKGGSRPALILGMSQRAVAWLRCRADRIEQGGQP